MMKNCLYAILIIKFQIYFMFQLFANPLRNIILFVFYYYYQVHKVSLYLRVLEFIKSLQ